MSDPIEDRLDAALDRGVQYPAENAEDTELLELLRIAAAVREQPLSPTPTTASVERGRARLMAALDVQRRRQAAGHSVIQSWRGQLRKLFSPLALLPRAGLIVGAVVVLLVIGGTLSASANSLPGDPFYEIKLLQEQVRISLAFSDSDREAVREQVDQTRTRELDAVRRQGRIVRTEITGILDAVGPSSLTVNGVELPINLVQFPALANSKPGDRVVITVQTMGDGSVEVIAFQLVPAFLLPPIATRVPSTATATIVPTSIPAASNTPRPQPADAGQPTTAPTLDDRPPTATPLSTRTPAPTRIPDNQATASPSRTPEREGTPDDQPTPNPSATPQPSRTPDGEDTPRPTETARPTETRQPTQTREPSRTPVPSATAGNQNSPTPSQSPQPTETRQPTRTPAPTQTQQPTRTLEPTRTLAPTRTPDSAHESDH